MTLIDKLELELANNSHKFNNWDNGFKAAIAIVKQHQAESGWISVDERLPEAYNDFLVCILEYDTGYQYQCVSYFDGNKWLDADGTIDFITHWRPLPQPPQQ